MSCGIAIVNFINIDSIPDLILFYSKRLLGQNSLKHPWLISSALNTELSITKGKLKRYVIKKRWIKAVNTIIALHRMGAKLDLDLV